MLPPRMEILAARHAARSDGPTTLDVLVRITPPAPEVHVLRPPINLGLVLDHSGSMGSAKKMDHAREAAAFAVEQLLPTDRVSVTIFDEEVETIVPNAPVANKAAIVQRIRTIVPRGSTALHDGWKEGAAQVARHPLRDGLNRVLLLSDGLANVGLSEPKAIAADVKAMTARGVSTSTMGVGDDYNEDLMEAMGTAGDGNYYYVQSTVQLADIFETELKGLMATTGRKVSLGLEPQNGVTVADVLNDLEKLPTGRLMMPNLITGMPVDVVVRLDLPPLAQVTELCRFRLAWDEPRRPERQSVRGALIVPAVPSSEWDAIPPHADVTTAAAVLEANRLKRQAVRHAEMGDFGMAQALLGETREHLVACYGSPVGTEELRALGELEAQFAPGNAPAFLKLGKHQMWRRTRGQPSSPVPPPSTEPAGGDPGPKSS